MSSWARKGVRCVCVNAENNPNMRWDGDAPIVGGVYTIRRTFIGPDGTLQADFDELRRSRSTIIEWNTKDVGYRLDRFRPLIQKTQSEDIEMFLRIASKAPSNMETTDA